MKQRVERQNALRACTLMVGLVASCTFTGCVVVGGSTRGGFFIWPGGLGLVLMILLVVFLLRRR